MDYQQFLENINECTKRSYNSQEFMEFLKYCPLARPHIRVKLY